MVNLYQLYFSFFYFLFQPNKNVFYPSTFPPLKPNTNEGRKTKSFLSSHFPIFPTKQALSAHLGTTYLTETETEIFC